MWWYIEGTFCSWMRGGGTGQNGGIWCSGSENFLWVLEEKTRNPFVLTNRLIARGSGKLEIFPDFLTFHKLKDKLINQKKKLSKEQHILLGQGGDRAAGSSYGAFQRSLSFPPKVAEKVSTMRRCIWSAAVFRWVVRVKVTPIFWLISVYIPCVSWSLTFPQASLTVFCLAKRMKLLNRFISFLPLIALTRVLTWETWPPPNLQTSPPVESQRLLCLQLTPSPQSRLCLPLRYRPGCVTVTLH